MIKPIIYGKDSMVSDPTRPGAVPIVDTLLSVQTWSDPSHYHGSHGEDRSHCDDVERSSRELSGQRVVPSNVGSGVEVASDIGVPNTRPLNEFL